jgi:peptidoglycan/LPS O-acetylase OafA/YrhL
MTTGGQPESLAPAGLGYRPGIDGLRALAVIAVMLFHAGFGWASGGFLGVSVFFTLSGFLIGSLVLAEQERTGRLDLARFWVRRARRLLPAALITLLGVVFLVSTRPPDARSSLFGDVIAALAYVSNWRFWANGQSYNALFAKPSPLLHFWSLAIEEQFYVFFPLLATVAARLRRGWVVVFGGLWVVGFVAAFVVWSGGHRTLGYYATFTRMPELLTGVLLAWLVRRLSLGRRGTSLNLDVAGFVALAMLAILVATSERTTGWLYAGGFALVSLLSAVVVHAVAGDGLVATAVGCKPLRTIGKVSYGLYLYHWPVYLWLNSDRIHESAFVLTGLRWLVTAMLAWASYRWLEQPIRHGELLKQRRALVPAIAVGIAAALLAIPVSQTSSASAARVDLGALQADLAKGLVTTTTTRTVTTIAAARTSSTQASVSSTTTSASAVYAGPPRVGIFGDSASLVLGDGLREGGNVLVGAASWIGCTVLQTGEIDFLIERRPVERGCAWSTRWPEFLTTSNIDIAVVSYGGWDAAERWLPGEATSRHIGDPVIDELLKRDLLGAADVLLATGKPVVWLTMPEVQFGRSDDPPKTLTMNDPARVKRFNELLLEAARQRPALHVIDFAGHLESLPGGQLDPGRRPDGVHLSPAAAADVAAWLSPQLIRLVRAVPPLGA